MLLAIVAEAVGWLQAPISVYTSGKGSSAAGLTATVVKDNSGEFFLEVPPITHSLYVCPGLAANAFTAAVSTKWDLATGYPDQLFLTWCGRHSSANSSGNKRGEWPGEAKLLVKLMRHQSTLLNLAATCSPAQ